MSNFIGLTTSASAAKFAKLKTPGKWLRAKPKPRCRNLTWRHFHVRHLHHSETDLFLSYRRMKLGLLATIPALEYALLIGGPAGQINLPHKPCMRLRRKSFVPSFRMSSVGGDQAHSRSTTITITPVELSLANHDEFAQFEKVEQTKLAAAALKSS